MKETTIHTKAFWFLRAKATRTRQFLNSDVIGQEITIYYDWLQGMTDSGQPGWSDSKGKLQRFASDEEAMECAKRVPPRYGYSWDSGRDVEAVYFSQTVTTVTQERTLEEIERGE